MSRKKTPIRTTAKPDSDFYCASKLFAFVAPFRALHDIRYYLQGVCFMPHPSGGVILAASDGHQLALAYDPEGYAKGQQVLRVSKQIASAAARRADGFVYLSRTNRLLVADEMLKETFIQAGDPKIEGAFPSVMRVVPRAESKHLGLRGAVNAAYLARLGRAAATLRRGESVPMTHWQCDDNGGVLTRFGARADVLAVTMPMRGEGIEKPLPDWMAAFDEKPSGPPPPKQPSDAAPPIEESARTYADLMPA